MTLALSEISRSFQMKFKSFVPLRGFKISNLFLQILYQDLEVFVNVCFKLIFLSGQFLEYLVVFKDFFGELFIHFSNDAVFF